MEVLKKKLVVLGCCIVTFVILTVSISGKEWFKVQFAEGKGFSFNH